MQVGERDDVKVDHACRAVAFDPDAFLAHGTPVPPGLVDRGSQGNG